MLELTLLGQVSPNSCHLLMDPLAMHQNTEWPGSEMYQSLNLLSGTKIQRKMAKPFHIPALKASS